MRWVGNSIERNGPPCWIVVPWLRDTSGQRLKVEWLWCFTVTSFSKSLCQLFWNVLYHSDWMLLKQTFGSLTFLWTQSHARMHVQIRSTILTKKEEWTCCLYKIQYVEWSIDATPRCAASVSAEAYLFPRPPLLLYFLQGRSNPCCF